MSHGDVHVKDFCKKKENVTVALAMAEGKPPFKPLSFLYL